MITDELISEKNGRKTIPHEAGRKNELTRQNVLRCAFAEFAQRGFDAGSVNAICQNGNISKGIIYYYFSSKEDLYLSCVEKCFQDLTDYLSARLQETEAATAQDLLTAYFDLRMIWFRNHPDAASLFCSAVMTPPASLKEKILSKKSVLDHFNAEVMRKILHGKALQPDLDSEEIIRIFQIFQDFFNAGIRTMQDAPADLEQYESACRTALHIFLYGILKQGVM